MTTTTSPASQTVDGRCAELAALAFIFAVNHRFAKSIGVRTYGAQQDARRIADRIIAIRTMHALGDLTIDAADRGAIAGTLRSQQVTP
jgi:hypothetical protein